MDLELSFDGACKLIKKDYQELADDIDVLVGLVSLFSVVVTGNPITANVIVSSLGTLSNIFTVKSELFKIGKKVIEKIAAKNESLSGSRLLRMEQAYCLLVYASFFEALGEDQAFAKFVKKIKVTNDEKKILSVSALKRLEMSEGTTNRKSNDAPETFLLNYRIGLPHPVDTFETQMKQLLPLFGQMAHGVMEFIQCLAVWDTTNETQQQTIMKAIDSLPLKAVEHFKAQYFLLATKYEEFFIWSNLQEHEKTRTHLREMSTYIQQYADLAEAGQKKIDLGFQDLGRIIKLLPEVIGAKKANAIIDELENLYSNIIEEPIIKDTFKDGNPELTYPKKSEIFVLTP